MTKSVAILGCGPAGLMAAHAAQLSGWDFVVYSRKVQSELFGAQYLHQPIPNLDCGNPRIIRYKLRGTPAEYRRKVYGPTWDGTVSPEDLLEQHHCWDLRRAYQDLWDLYYDHIWDADLSWSVFDDGDLAAGITKACSLEKHDLVISTVPRTIWDTNKANFHSTKVWAAGSKDPNAGLASQDDFTVICDGTNLATWYRSAKIYGYQTLEWPDQLVKPDYAAVRVTKPLRYAGDAAPDFLHIGRYGAWQKGLLTSDAFFTAMQAFAEDSIALGRDI